MVWLSQHIPYKAHGAFFPSRSACRFDTNGERRLAERLEKKLDDDYLCWFNIPVGPKALQPDFVILHPQWGVLVLEVKDWKLETILSMTKGTADLNDQGQPKTVKNLWPRRGCTPSKWLSLCKPTLNSSKKQARVMQATCSCLMAGVQS